MVSICLKGHTSMHTLHIAVVGVHTPLVSVVINLGISMIFIAWENLMLY